MPLLIVDKMLLSFDGDMTFEFSNGLQVRVPNSQFLVPYVDIDRNGSRVFNTSERELLVNGVYDQPATLGRYFLTAAYLMVDQDEGTFTLWQANPSSSSLLVPVMGSKAQTACQDGTIGDPSTNTTSNPGGSNGNSAVSDTQDGRKLAGGAIAGIAFGSVVAISSIGAVVFFLRRSRKQQNPVSTIDQAYDTPYNSDQQYPNKLVGTPYGNNLPENERVHELHDAQSGVAEMYGQHEARVYEMDGSHHSR